MISVQLSAIEWRGATVAVATTFRERLLGLRSRGAARGVMLRTKSVHTFGMDRAITMFALDHRSRVIVARSLRPNRVVFYRRATAIVELPVEADPPPLFAEVVIS